jgi:hypothetical protein
MNSSVNCRRARLPALVDPILDIVSAFRKVSTKPDQAQTAQTTVNETRPVFAAVENLKEREEMPKYRVTQRYSYVVYYKNVKNFEADSAEAAEEMASNENPHSDDGWENEDADGRDCGEVEDFEVEALTSEPNGID